jgi:hypothetical protein
MAIHVVIVLAQVLVLALALHLALILVAFSFASATPSGCVAGVLLRRSSRGLVILFLFVLVIGLNTHREDEGAGH